MRAALALVHHANQFLITNGYENREGLAAVLGNPKSQTGLWRVLEAHLLRRVPINLHLSGTLLEAIAWHQPDFLALVRELHREGLVEFIGSCHGQNIMRFFSYAHNLVQLNEELRLFERHLEIDPAEVHAFWPPERVWDTARMAPVLGDPRTHLVVAGLSGGDIRHRLGQPGGVLLGSRAFAAARAARE